MLDDDPTIPKNLRQSLRDRVTQLRRESVRQALHRLCDSWFPANKQAKTDIDYAYGIRSQLLHEGRLEDLDVELPVETRKVAGYLRQVYASAFGIALRSGPAV